MREIKFRAWDNRISKMSKPFAFGQILNFCDKSGLGHMKSICDYHKIMQFTGLKDKNGKEIYESDILIDKEADEYGNDISGYLPVVFCQNTAQWCVDNSFKKDGNHLVNIVEYLGIEHLEVVGNIYENPLVLENENRVI